MKGYNNDRLPMVEPAAYGEDFQVRPAKMLGSSIMDGRFSDVAGAFGILHGQYDDPNSMDVDPLCDMNTDIAGLGTKLNVPQNSETSTE